MTDRGTTAPGSRSQTDGLDYTSSSIPTQKPKRRRASLPGALHRQKAFATLSKLQPAYGVRGQAKQSGARPRFGFDESKLRAKLQAQGESRAQALGAKSKLHFKVLKARFYRSSQSHNNLIK